MPGTHALLSPSGAKRWITCTPSVRLEQTFADRDSVEAQEGTLAHSLSDLLIKRKLRWIKEVDYKREIKEIERHELYSEAMLDYCEEYSVFVLEKYHNALARNKDAKLYLEERVDLSDYAPECFGTADRTIIADHIMDVIDLKFGKGVPVSAFENEQTMMYALGMYLRYHFLFSIDIIRITIYQPRINNTNTFEITPEKLLEWAETVLKPAAVKAFKGEGEFVAGDHCKFCRARNRCRAHADYYMDSALTAFAEESKPTVLLSFEDVANILNKVDGLVSYAKSVKDWAVDELKNGKVLPGWKIVEGRATRKYTDKDAIAKILKAHKFEETDIFEKKLLGITKMQTLIGKSSFDAWLNDYLIKPYGKPTLAKENDKRPAYDRSKEAADVFEEDE